MRFMFCGKALLKIACMLDESAHRRRKHFNGLVMAVTKAVESNVYLYLNVHILALQISAFVFYRAKFLELIFVLIDISEQAI